MFRAQPSVRTISRYRHILFSSATRQCVQWLKFRDFGMSRCYGGKRFPSTRVGSLADIARPSTARSVRFMIANCRNTTATAARLPMTSRQGMPQSVEEAPAHPTHAHGLYDQSRRPAAIQDWSLRNAFVLFNRQSPVLHLRTRWGCLTGERLASIVLPQRPFVDLSPRVAAPPSSPSENSTTCRPALHSGLMRCGPIISGLCDCHRGRNGAA